MSLVPTTTIELNVTADVDALVAATPGLRVVGVEVIEEASGTFEFYLVNGPTGATAARKKPFKGAADLSADKWFWPGLDFGDGVSIDWISGDVTVYVHTITTPVR